MNIDILESKLPEINNPMILAILELLIEATRDYPLYGLDDIFDYFTEVEKVLKAESITGIELEKYLNSKNYNINDTTIWLISSLSLFYEAFELMKLSKVSFEEVKRQIKDLDNSDCSQLPHESFGG
jgi:hypothetical protein